MHCSTILLLMLSEHWNIAAVQMKDEIQVKFDSHMKSEMYEIRLRRKTHILSFAKVTVVCNA